MKIQRHCCHNPLFCIVPPHMLREISTKGSKLQKKQALSTLKASGQLRGQRLEMADITVRRSAHMPSAKNRTVYDAKNQQVLPGTKVRGEGDPPTNDAAVDEAYDGAGHTYDLYNEIFERNSIDNRGMELISTVHYGIGFDNAFWNGEQMAYGDGDEDLPGSERMFNRFTIALDIIGHELAHGVTQHEAGLVYRNQSGALNESMSDVFGSLVKQYKLKQTAEQANWLIGEGLFTRNVNAQAIRSMKAPGTAYDDARLGKDPQPAHIKDIYTGVDDNGGVHINSGIPNHAFYLTATQIGGFAWEKAGRIWYAALSEKIRPSTDFHEGARLIFQSAGELFGEGSKEQEAVHNGWAAVGIDLTNPKPEPQPIPPAGCMVAPLTALGSVLDRAGGFF